MAVFTIPVVQLDDFSLTTKVHLYNCIAPIESFPVNLPLDANLRSPDKNAVVVSSMVKTLQQDPEQFVFMNQGVKIVAEELRPNIDDLGVCKSITLKIIKMVQGVEDGSHTICAIARAKEQNIDLSKGYVKLFIRVGVAAAASQKICVGLNTSRRVDQRSKLNKLGVFNELRSKLEKVYFAEVQYNQSNDDIHPRCNILYVIKILWCLDRNRFNYLQGIHPSNVIKGSVKVNLKSIKFVEDAFDNLFLDVMKVEIRICDLVKEFSYNRFNDGGFNKIPGVREARNINEYTKLTNGLKYPIVIPSNISLPIIAALRPFVNPNTHNWIDNFSSFGMPLVQELWKPYLSYLKKQHSLGRTFNVAISTNEIYSILCAHAQEFRSKLDRPA